MSTHETSDPIHLSFSRKISRRTFSVTAIGLGLSASAAGSLLTACGSDTNGSGQSSSGQITVWTWPDNDKTFAKTIPIFNRQFPQIKVKVQAYGTNYHDKLLAAIVAGTGPDVAMVEISNVAKFKSKPGFVDLAQAPYSVGQYKNNYAPYSWGYVSDQKTGRIFALPKNTGPGAMFYRRDLFEKAGLPTDPAKVHELLRDWDSFLTVGKALTVKGSQWMTSSPGMIFNTIIAEAGLSYYDAQGNLQIDKPAFRDALQYAQKAWDAGLISPFADWSAEWGAALGNGTVATHFWGNWFGGLLKSTYAKGTDGKWGVAYAPAYTGNTAYDSGGDFIGILETSNNKAAAWEFCKFVTQDPGSLQTMYSANDLYPAWAPALSANWINVPDPFYAGQQVNATFSKVQAQMVPPVTNPHDPIVNSVLANALADVTRGNVSVSDALTKAEQQIKAQTGQ